MGGYNKIVDSVQFSLQKEFHLVGKIIFCKFAAEMVALPSKSGGVKEHQKGMR